MEELNIFNKRFCCPRQTQDFVRKVREGSGYWEATSSLPQQDLHNLSRMTEPEIKPRGCEPLSERSKAAQASICCFQGLHPLNHLPHRCQSNRFAAHLPDLKCPFAHRMQSKFFGFIFKVPGKMVQSRCHPRCSRKKDCSGLDVHLEEKRVPAQGSEELNLAVRLEVEVIWAGVWRQPLQMHYH